MTIRTVPVEHKIESLHVELSLPGGMNVNYDTSDPNAKIDNPQLAFLEEVFKLTAEIAYTVVLDDHNKVKAIEGSEKLLEKAEKLSLQARSAIRSQVEADTLKQSFEQELRHLPDVLARPAIHGNAPRSSTSAAVKRSRSKKSTSTWVPRKWGTRRSRRSPARRPAPNRSRIPMSTRASSSSRAT